MTVNEAAAALNTTADALRHAIHRGALTARKVGRDWHVSASAVEAYRRRHLGRPGGKKL